LETALTYGENLRSKIIMGCGEDFAQTGLQAIADSILAIANRECCPASGTPGAVSGSGSGGSGTSAGDYESGEDIDENTFPDGFESYAAYRVYKCNVASFLVARIRDDIQNLQTVNIVGTAVVALMPLVAPLLATPIPFDELIAVVVILGVAIGYAGGILGDIEDGITNSFDDLVCSLVSAGNSEDAETALELAFSDAIEAETGDALTQTYAKQIFNSFVSADSLRGLFEKDDTRIYPTVSCDCAEGCVLSGVEVVVGTASSDTNDGTDRTLVITSDDDPDYPGVRQAILLDIPEGCSFAFITTEWSGSPPAGSGVRLFRCDDSDLTTDFPLSSGNLYPSASWKWFYVWNGNTTPFAIQVTFRVADC